MTGTGGRRRGWNWSTESSRHRVRRRWVTGPRDALVHVWRTVALCVAAGIVVPAAGQGQEGGAAQSVAVTQLRGAVADGASGAPVPNAQVRVLGVPGDVATWADGTFVVRDLPAGEYTLRVNALGYRVREMPFVASPDGTPFLRVTVEATPLEISEIVVTPGRFGIMGTAAPATRQTLTREDLETIPQLGEDVFRSLQRVPGVAAEDLSTRLNVRGGSDQEMLVTVDGAELYEPYHLKDFDGVLGIVDVQSVGGIDMITGGFPVEYGDKTAGVFNMQTLDPPVQQTRTAVGLSIMNLSFMSRGTFDSGDGSWLVSARRGYLDIALALTDSDGGFSPTYWDALAKTRYRVHRNHTVSAHFLYASDDLTFEEDGDFVDSKWRSTYGWLGWQAELTPLLRAHTVASFGRVTRNRGGFENDPEFSPGLEAHFADDSRVFDVFGLKQDWSYELSDNALLKVGFDGKLGTADYDYLSWSRPRPSSPGGDPGPTDSTVVATTPDGNELGLYTAARFRTWGRLTTEVGLRYDRQTHTGDDDLAPRIHAAMDLGGATQLRASIGRYYQSHGLHELSVGDGESEFTRSEWANQVAVGVERSFGRGMNIRVEGYVRAIENPRRRYFNLSREILPFPEAEEDRVRIEPTEARARGLELMVAQNAGRLSWSASYALSATEGLVEGVWTPRFFDQPHAFQSMVSYGTESGWRFSVGWQYHTGWPITPREFAADTLGTNPDTGEPVIRAVSSWGALNGDRLPAYHRLDLRVSRSFEVGRGLLSVFLDVFNLYNRANLRSYGYDVRLVGDELVTRKVPGEEQLPVLPSLGIRWEF